MSHTTETVWDRVIPSNRICCKNCRYSSRHVKSSRRVGCDFNKDGACLNSGLQLDRIIEKNIQFTNNGTYRYSNFEPYFEGVMFSDKDFEL
jgi:hypothetical protein